MESKIYHKYMVTDLVKGAPGGGRDRADRDEKKSLLNGTRLIAYLNGEKGTFILTY